MLGLTFSSKLDRRSYIISIAKTVSKKIGAMVHSMKFLSPEVAMYLYKTTIRPYMEYFSHFMFRFFKFRVNLAQRCIQKPVKHLRWIFMRKWAISLKPL